MFSICDLLSGEDEAIVIRSALNIIEAATCVKFERIFSRAGSIRYIKVLKGSG